MTDSRSPRMESTVEFTEDQLYVIHVAASDLFEQAVAQGMHSPFSLDVHSWGFTWADKLVGDLTRSATDSTGDPDA